VVRMKSRRVVMEFHLQRAGGDQRDLGGLAHANSTPVLALEGG
jgi:hypothetical protein